ncbi:hypothetical protein V8C42DRAFT_341189 [Trichoderma barbatum]
MDTFQNAPNGRASNPRKQRQMQPEAGLELQAHAHQDGTGRTATEAARARATPTPTPRYGLRAPRASQGSFSTPSRYRRTASQQHLQHLSTPTKTSGSGAAAIRTGSPLSYSIGH